ncbi:TetR family transcriptional regulator C-terminal domain-containing protein [Micromonospora sp. NPDC003944]
MRAVERSDLPLHLRSGWSGILVLDSASSAEEVPRPLRTTSGSWIHLMARTIEDARQLGDLAETIDAEQLAFELIALLELANATSLLHGDPIAYRRAPSAIEARLGFAATGPLPIADVQEPWGGPGSK